MLEGSCHCGAIAIRLDTDRRPDELPVRICGCGFCRRHRPRYTSDPAGQVTIRADEAALGRYRFGLRLADFLVCRTCGVFVAAFEPDEAAPGRGRAVVNALALDRAAELTAAPTHFTAYDTEDAAARRARRARAWMPAQLTLS